MNTPLTTLITRTTKTTRTLSQILTHGALISTALLQLRKSKREKEVVLYKEIVCTRDYNFKKVNGKLANIYPPLSNRQIPKTHHPSLPQPMSTYLT
jgi:hypothetical protein